MCWVKCWVNFVFIQKYTYFASLWLVSGGTRSLRNESQWYNHVLNHTCIDKINFGFRILCTSKNFENGPGASLPTFSDKLSIYFLNNFCRCVDCATFQGLKSFCFYQKIFFLKIAHEFIHSSSINTPHSSPLPNSLFCSLL